MIVNLINKHGLMPKKCFPESFSCESSVKMNTILKSKVRSISNRISCNILFHCKHNSMLCNYVIIYF